MKTLNFKVKIEQAKKNFAKRALLPSTIFSKRQITKLRDRFDIFFGKKLGSVVFTKPKHFSTFSLASPYFFWSYYFDSDALVSKLRDEYEPISIEIPVDNRTLIKGLYLKKKEGLSNRLLINFNGNAELYLIGGNSYLVKMILETALDYDFIFFDYRECGESKGDAFAHGLIEDGLSVFSFATNQLGYLIDNIDLHGFSLGGAIATYVKYNYPKSKGFLINNRSFCSLNLAIKKIFTPFDKTIGEAASRLAFDVNWSLDPIKIWNAIECEKLVIFHKKDPIVKYSASLQYGLKRLNHHPNTTFIELKQREKRLIFNHHVHPLSFYNDASGIDAKAVLLKFFKSMRLK